jgi:DNA-binding NarL/FixJ family response regulator
VGASRGSKVFRLAGVFALANLGNTEQAGLFGRKAGKAGTTILLVDDFAAVRRGLRNMLESRHDWTVIGEAADGLQGLEQAQLFQPTVAVVDISMPKMNGLALTREIRRLLPDIEVLIVTEHDSRQMLREAQQAGAHGYIVKSQAGSHLLPAIQALSEHRAFFRQDPEM